MSIKKNTVWNLVGSGVPLLIAAVVIPKLVKLLGVELFGLLSIIWTLIGYFSLFDLGLGRAITHHVSANSSDGSIVGVSDGIKSGIKFATAAGVLGCLLISALAWPASHSWLNISKQFQTETEYALIFAAIGIPFVALSSAMRGVLEGAGQFGVVNLVKLFQGVTTFIFPLMSIYVHGASLQMMTIWLVLSRVITLVCYWQLIRHSFGTKWLKSNDKNKQQEFNLLKFGAWMTVSNIISPLLIYLDRFIISGMYGAGMIAFYTVPFEILTRLLIVPGAIGSALFPKLTREYNQNNKVNKLLLDAAKITGLSMAAICSVIVLLYMPMMSWWISKEFAIASVKIVKILSVGIWMNSIGYIIYTAIQAKIGAKQTAIIHILELIFYVPILWFLLSRYGLVGAAIAWTARVSLDALIMYIVFRRMGRFSGNRS